MAEKLAWTVDIKLAKGELFAHKSPRPQPQASKSSKNLSSTPIFFFSFMVQRKECHLVFDGKAGQSTLEVCIVLQSDSLVIIANTTTNTADGCSFKFSVHTLELLL